MFGGSVVVLWWLSRGERFPAIFGSSIPANGSSLGFHHPCLRGIGRAGPAGDGRSRPGSTRVGVAKRLGGRRSSRGNFFRASPFLRGSSALDVPVVGRYGCYFIVGGSWDDALRLLIRGGLVANQGI
ncbi:uncharacterized protein BO95DRAFT_220627 [Aspergillus brunneoviolaceus CBS 621.78]|uniref:Uncharacterized protein n=1 Tax=Aspergillus brunneoviolaceus CBS 621.78 TaxID=1450534 RepID=A0ACD1GLB9_9EURO|nr:hypothetical protein BO95DRAFT_220627 [Aspergillus brunneoviolaceus CBS 621.78]RAH50061.1 hypothetical protein BO95DRAFT_220627 [Aspergillus brunneoviolaceus CBS 621.78]